MAVYYECRISHKRGYTNVTLAYKTVASSVVDQKSGYQTLERVISRWFDDPNDCILLQQVDKPKGWCIEIDDHAFSKCDKKHVTLK